MACVTCTCLNYERFFDVFLSKKGRVFDVMMFVPKNSFCLYPPSRLAALRPISTVQFFVFMAPRSRCCSVFSLSNMVLFFTRFTDEIFSLLISVIFIMEAVKDISGGWRFDALTVFVPHSNSLQEAFFFRHLV